jgi:hypothetical protein
MHCHRNSGAFAYREFDISADQYNAAVAANNAWLAGGEPYSYSSMCGTFTQHVVAAAGFSIGGSTPASVQPQSLFHEFGGTWPNQGQGQSP